MKNFLLITLAACLCSLYGSQASAQYSRAYPIGPKGTNILELNAITTTASTDDTDALENVKTESLVYSPAFIHVTEGLFGKTAVFGVTMPLVDSFSYDRTSNTVLNDKTGLGDMMLLFDHNFFGGDSITKEEAADTIPGTYGGIHFGLLLPTGNYSKSKSSNIGGNRWMLNTMYQHSLAFNDAATWLEFYGSVKIFGDNDDFMGSNTFSQDPILGLEVYLSHDLAPEVFIETGMAYSHGGAISINGTEEVESQNTLNGAIGLRAPMWKKAAIRFLYSPTLYDNRDEFVKGYSVRTTFQQVF